MTDAVPSLRVLITGATSQLGRALLPMLQDEGHEVIALSRDLNGVDATLAQWRKADLTEGWPSVDRCDVLVSFGPMQSLADALASLNVAPCRRLVATSSMSAVSKQDSRVAEDRQLSASLRNAEAALVAQCERLGIGWTVLRPTMIYGLGMDQNLSPVARRALQTRMFPYPKGRGLRQPVHAIDIATAAWQAAITATAEGQIIPIGGGERLRIDDMFRRVRDGLPRWTLPIALPRWFLRLLEMTLPKLRGALSRVDVDLTADNGPLEAILGVRPRRFQPDVARWLEEGR